MRYSYNLSQISPTSRPFNILGSLQILLVCLVFSLTALTSCGRYGPPLPPAAYTASEVQDLIPEVTSAGVTLRWSSPSKDRRGQTITNLTRFDVLRADTAVLSDFLKDPVGESEVVGTVFTSHVELLEAKREAARLQKLPSRQITIPGSLKQFSFVDSSLLPGRSYIYSIVPLGEDEVPGQVSQFVKVDFIGDGSSTQIFTPDVFDRAYILGLSQEEVRQNNQVNTSGDVVETEKAKERSSLVVQ